MIFTSYFSSPFARYVAVEVRYAISGSVPDWFTGQRYSKLAPKIEWWREWRDKKLSNEWFRERYYETVLSNLDPLDIAKEVGDGAVLFCWEDPEQFCHRKLVAEWMQKSGILVEELNKDNIRNRQAITRFGR